MGRQLSSFPAEPRRQQRQHPWEDWMNGEPWELERGVDFDQDLEAFRNRFFTKKREKKFAGVYTHSYLHAVDAETAARLLAASPRRKKDSVAALPDLIRRERDPEEKQFLKDRLARLKAEGRDHAELLAIQFYGPPDGS